MKQKQPKPWLWYIARRTELLLDFDTEGALFYGRQRLQRAMRRGFLDVREVYLERSVSRDSYHMAVRLRKPMPAVERGAWEIFLHSDLTRGLYNLMRLQRRIRGAGLLIRRTPFSYRKPDYVCYCRTNNRDKHKPLKVTRHCPALKVLQGDAAGAEYFPRNRDRKRRKRSAVLPFGKVPLSRILYNRKVKRGKRKRV